MGRARPAIKRGACPAHATRHSIAACGSATTVLDFRATALSAQPYGMAAPLTSCSEGEVSMCGAICDLGVSFLFYFIRHVLHRLAALSIHMPSRILLYLCANLVHGKMDASRRRSPPVYAGL